MNLCELSVHQLEIINVNLAHSFTKHHNVISTDLISPHLVPLDRHHSLMCIIRHHLPLVNSSISLQQARNTALAHATQLESIHSTNLVCCWHFSYRAGCGSIQAAPWRYFWWKDLFLFLIDSLFSRIQIRGCVEYTNTSFSSFFGPKYVHMYKYFTQLLLKRQARKIKV